MTNPTVSVLLLTKNPGRQFKKVIDMIARQRGIGFEIVIIDSGSIDGTLELLKDYPVRLHRIKPETFGHGKTRNLAASLAKGSLLAFVTHDSEPSGADWLANLAAPFSDLSVAGVFGRQVPKLGADVLEKYYLNYLYPEVGRKLSLPDGQRYELPKYFFSNANSMIRKSVWGKFKFPEDNIMSEDQWWARRVLRAGYKIVYQPKAIVKHSHSYNLEDLFRRNFDSGASLKGIDEASILKSLLGFTSYLTGETLFLLKRGKFWLLGYAFFKESVRALGYIGGQYYFLIPKRLRRSMSLHGYFWR